MCSILYGTNVGWNTYTGVISGMGVALVEISTWTLLLTYAVDGQHARFSCHYSTLRCTGIFLGCVMVINSAWDSYIMNGLYLDVAGGTSSSVYRDETFTIAFLFCGFVLTIFLLARPMSVVRSDNSSIEGEMYSYKDEMKEFWKLLSSPTMGRLSIYFLTLGLPELFTKSYAIFQMFNMRASSLANIIYASGEIIGLLVLTNSVDKFLLTNRWTRKKLYLVIIWLNGFGMAMYFFFLTMISVTSCNGRTDRINVPTEFARIAYDYKKNEWVPWLTLNQLPWFPDQNGQDGCDYLDDLLEKNRHLTTEECKESPTCVLNMVTCVPDSYHGSCRMDMVNTTAAHMCNPVAYPLVDKTDCFDVMAQYSQETLLIYITLMIGGIASAIYKNFMMSVLGIMGRGSARNTGRLVTVASFLEKLGDFSYHILVVVFGKFTFRMQLVFVIIAVMIGFLSQTAAVEHICNHVEYEPAGSINFDKVREDEAADDPWPAEFSDDTVSRGASIYTMGTARHSLGGTLHHSKKRRRKDRSRSHSPNSPGLSASLAVAL